MCPMENPSRPPGGQHSAHGGTAGDQRPGGNEIKPLVAGGRCGQKYCRVGYSPVCTQVLHIPLTAPILSPPMRLACPPATVGSGVRTARDGQERQAPPALNVAERCLREGF